EGAPYRETSAAGQEGAILRRGDEPCSPGKCTPIYPLGRIRTEDVAQSGEEYAEQLQYVAAGRAKSRSLTPLRQVLPFLFPYRYRTALATFALMISSTATLVLPALARRLIDHVGAAELNQLSRYFLPLLRAAAVLGIATARRFYFVTWIGERVVADIRRAVFDHILGLTPSFFEVTRTGEVVSRLTADPTLIQTVVGSSISV